MSADQDRYLRNKLSDDSSHLIKENALLNQQVIELQRQLERVSWLCTMVQSYWLWSNNAISAQAVTILDSIKLICCAKINTVNCLNLSSWHLSGEMYSCMNVWLAAPSGEDLARWHWEPPQPEHHRAGVCQGPWEKPAAWAEPDSGDAEAWAGEGHTLHAAGEEYHTMSALSGRYGLQNGC